MAKIHVLPQEIVSKIAAGEVIERPASVVKELLENSIDAKTTSIELTIKDAGKTLINIKDTGCGIEQADLENVFIRHSTSKISDMSDLYKINSLGFRGEALYSIAAISDVTLRSKTRTETTGWEIHCRGNKRLSLHPLALTEGTVIEIKELFYNTPARRKFLKSDNAELHQILNIVIPYTILYPKVSFRLINNGKTLFDLTGQDNPVIRIAKALNLDAKYLLEEKREYKNEGISAHIILGDINIQRANKDLQFIFVNGRPVQNRNLSFNINQVYRMLLPEQIKPFFAVSLKLPAENVDVNIHPTKREIKISNEQQVISILRLLCEKTLMSYGKVKQLKETPIQNKNTGDPVLNRNIEFAASSISKSISPQLGEENTFVFENETASKNLQDPLGKLLTDAYFIGIFQNKYLLFGAKHSMLVIDQHAAHERITYEQLKRQIDSGTLERQNLLMPVLVRVTRQEMLIWEETKETLEKIGLTTTLWDNDTIALHSQPQLIKNAEIALRNILSEEKSGSSDIDSIAARACRLSVMTGDQLKKEEAESLKTQLLKCEIPFTCPHGRPTIIEIQDTLLNKQFLR